MLHYAAEHEHRLGVAPLCALDVSHADFIRAAGDAGFAAVGLRLHQVSSTDPVFPRNRQSLAFRDIRSALAETELEVLDIEVLTLRRNTAPSEWLPLLELGAELGAKYLTLGGEIPSYQDLADKVSALTIDARSYGIQPILEPVAFRDLNNFETAVSVAREAGCGILLDVLHFLRTGASISTVETNKDLFPLLQLCDAPPVMAGTTPDQTPSQHHDLMVAEARANRLLPGEGAAPIPRLMEVLNSETRISVEIPNARLRGSASPSRYLKTLRVASCTYLRELSRATSLNTSTE